MSAIEEASPSSSRHKGQVKFFNSTKGYGFILPQSNDENDVEEIFVHHTAIHNKGGFQSLAEGEQVEYDLVKGPKGMQASHVTGPEGKFVQGDPRTHRPKQYQNNGGYYRNNNNQNGPYTNNNTNGGYMMDPYAYGYAAIPGYPYMNLQQPMYATPQYMAQYGYSPSSQSNTSNNLNNNLSPPSYLMYQQQIPQTLTNQQNPPTDEH